MSIIREIEVTRKGLPRPIDVTYGTNMLPIEFIVTDFNIPEGVTAKLYAMGESKVVKSQDAEVSGNKITFTPEIGFFDERKNVLQIAIDHEGKNLFSFDQPVNCHYTMKYTGALDLSNSPTFVEMVLELQKEVEELKKNGTGGASEEQIKNAVNEYLDENPVAAGATAEQAAQIEKNKQDITKISETKIDLPSTGSVGQILEVETVDDNGKPKTFKAVDKPSSGSTSGSSVGSNYKYEYIGCPFEALDDYQSWPIAGVQYDKAKDKIMCLVTDADVHVSSTRFRLRLFALDPVTGEATLVNTLKDNTVDPVVYVHTAFGSQRGFLIDNETGIYYKFHFDGSPYACKSSDGGVTWEDIAITETNSTDILFGTGNGKIIKTSSGRIICGLFCNGFAYTDDYFQTLTYVTSGKITSNGSACCHEYELIEYEVGKIVAIMRYTWSSTNTGAWNGTKVIEPAWISYSEDNGTTWSVPVASNSITNMSATNCVAYVHEDSLDLFVGCRYPIFTNKSGAMFRHTAKLSDIPSDKFELQETMFYWNSNNLSSYDDTGNLDGCADSNGNFHLFYNDSSDNETCRWHYIKVSKSSDNGSNIKEVVKNKETQTYNAKVIDILLNELRKYVGEVKQELLLKLGELPESGDLINPTYWVSDGLIAMYMVEENYWDATTNNLTPAYTHNGAYDDAVMHLAKGEWDGSAPETYDGRFLYGKSEAQNLLDDVFCNSSDGWTLEVDLEAGTFTSNTNNINIGVFNLLSYSSANIYEYSTTAAKTGNKLCGYDVRESFPIVNHSIDAPHTITYTFDKKNMISAIYIDGKLVIDSTNSNVTDGYSLDLSIGNTSIKGQYDNSAFIEISCCEKSAFRLYNRPLTAEEVKANAIYSNS